MPRTAMEVRLRQLPLARRGITARCNSWTFAALSRCGSNSGLWERQDRRGSLLEVEVWPESRRGMIETCNCQPVGLLVRESRAPLHCLSDFERANSVTSAVASQWRGRVPIICFKNSHSRAEALPAQSEDVVLNLIPRLAALHEGIKAHLSQPKPLAIGWSESQCESKSVSSTPAY